MQAKENKKTFKKAETHNNQKCKKHFCKNKNWNDKKSFHNEIKSLKQGSK